MLRRVAGIMGKSLPKTYATWNPSDKSTLITLSGGNLVADRGQTATGSFRNVRSTINKSSGKWYWEVTITTKTGNNSYLGIANATQSLDSTPAAPNANWIDASNWAQGDVIGIAVDQGAGNITYYKNGALLIATAAHGVTGNVYAFWSAFNIDNTVTANFGASAFTYTPPSGYNAGLYT